MTISFFVHDSTTMADWRQFHWVVMALCTPTEALSFKLR